MAPSPLSRDECMEPGPFFQYASNVAYLQRMFDQNPAAIRQERKLPAQPRHIPRELLDLDKEDSDPDPRKPPRAGLDVPFVLQPARNRSGRRPGTLMPVENPPLEIDTPEPAVKQIPLNDHQPENSVRLTPMDLDGAEMSPTSLGFSARELNGGKLTPAALYLPVLQLDSSAKTTTRLLSVSDEAKQSRQFTPMDLSVSQPQWTTGTIQDRPCPNPVNRLVPSNLQGLAPVAVTEGFEELFISSLPQTLPRRPVRWNAPPGGQRATGSPISARWAQTLRRNPYSVVSADDPESSDDEESISSPDTHPGPLPPLLESLFNSIPMHSPPDQDSVQAPEIIASITKEDEIEEKVVASSLRDTARRLFSFISPAAIARAVARGRRGELPRPLRQVSFAAKPTTSAAADIDEDTWTFNCQTDAPISHTPYDSPSAARALSSHTPDGTPSAAPVLTSPTTNSTPITTQTLFSQTSIGVPRPSAASEPGPVTGRPRRERKPSRKALKVAADAKFESDIAQAKKIDRRRRRK